MRTVRHGGTVIRRWALHMTFYLTVFISRRLLYLRLYYNIYINQRGMANSYRYRQLKQYRVLLERTVLKY